MPQPPSSPTASTSTPHRRPTLGGTALLMMAAVLASRFVGYFRDAYVAYAFGAGRATDAFVTAFTIPDWLNYLVAGGALSITFITLFSDYIVAKEEQEGYRVFSTVATFLSVLLIVGVAAGELWTPAVLRWYVPQFTAAQLASCVWMTRVLLPAQLFFCVGSLAMAVLYARGSFLIPALTPLIYNLCMIAGGVVFGHWLGIAGMAVGALAGALVGPFLAPIWAAARSGLRYRPNFAWGDPAFRKWLHLTLPLMIGVSLVTADDWIIRHLGAAFPGAIAQLNFAKKLTRVPIAVLGQAVGQASMPFYTWLVAEQKWDQFRETVDRSVFRTATGALLATSWLAALALPVVRLVYERGRFGAAQAHATALYFAIFMLSLVFWSVQGLYARAFYATQDTLTPMVAGTLITLLMIPFYVWCAHQWGVTGLVIASDTGIVTQTVVLAVLLKRKQWLAFKPRRWRALPKLVLCAALPGGIVASVLRRVEPAHYHWRKEIALFVLGSLFWTLLVALCARLFGVGELIAEAQRLIARVLNKAGLRVGFLTASGETRTGGE